LYLAPLLKFKSKEEHACEIQNVHIGVISSFHDSRINFILLLFWKNDTHLWTENRRRYFDNVYPLFPSQNKYRRNLRKRNKFYPPEMLLMSMALM